MSAKLRSHLRSNVIGYVALFFALSAGTYAASTAPKNSVVSRSIKNGQVKTADLGNGVVTNPKLADAAVSAAKVQANSLTGGQIDESGLDSGVLQQRVSGDCSAGQAIRSVAQNGAVSCGSSAGGPAGGDLTGTYPSPLVGPDAVGSSEVSDGSLRIADIAVGSKTFQQDLSSIAAESCADIVVSVSGSQAGDVLTVFSDVDLEQGLVPVGQIQYDGPIGQWRLCNTTSAAIDPASHTYKVVALR